jgi:hypothetical protein
MRRGALKSDLIKTIGHSGDVLEIEYTDGTIFQYVAPLSVFRKIVQAKSPGATWLKIRPQYKFKQL